MVDADLGPIVHRRRDAPASGTYPFPHPEFDRHLDRGLRLTFRPL